MGRWQRGGLTKKKAAITVVHYITFDLQFNQAPRSASAVRCDRLRTSVYTSLDEGCVQELDRKRAGPIAQTVRGGVEHMNYQMSDSDHLDEAND